MARILNKKLILIVVRAVVIAMLLTLVPLDAGAMAIQTWTQTTQDDFAGGMQVHLDITTSAGDVMLDRIGSDRVYAFKGNCTNIFMQYDVDVDDWTDKKDAKKTIGEGGALAYGGGDYIYALAGGGTKYFMHYNITTDQWTLLDYTGVNVRRGGSLAYDNGYYIYALFGGCSNAFKRYNIISADWETLDNLPFTVKGGGSLVYALDGGSGYLFALEGKASWPDESTNFWRYDISHETWTEMEDTPGNVGDGGALTWGWGNYIYAYSGSSSMAFWQYDIAADAWTIPPLSTMLTVMCCWDGGGALTYDGNDGIYGFLGNDTYTFGFYDIAAGTVESRYDTDYPIGYGGALAYWWAPYYNSGELTSSAFDTGYAAAFGDISWNAVMPAGTQIKFQIATNNDNATWIFKGPDGTAYTYYTSSGADITGHDGNRYIKYKAFFSTTNTHITPILNDVSISYTQSVSLPSATTNPATLVEETTATIHGEVDNDGGEVCQSRFQYGTSPGVYTMDTGWTGSVTAGDDFYADITGLDKGTKYYFRAQVKNSAGTGSGAELDFLTKPDPPVDTTFTATALSDTEIALTWVKGEGALNTAVYRDTDGYPVDRNDGVQVYFNTGTGFTDSGLDPDIVYYYRAWSQVTGSEQWSDGYRDATAQTQPVPTTPPPTTTPTTTTPVISVGGDVYPVNKAVVLAPWLAGFSAFIMAAGVITFKIVRSRRKI